METYNAKLNYGFSVPYLKVGTSDGRNVILLEGFTYKDKKGNVYKIEAGSGSDGASVPQIMWATMPPFGKYWMAAVLHDASYRYLKISKETCDYLLKESAELLGATPQEVTALYEGVRVFGWDSFNEDRIAHMKPEKLK